MIESRCFCRILTSFKIMERFLKCPLNLLWEFYGHPVSFEKLTPGIVRTIRPGITCFSTIYLDGDDAFPSLQLLVPVYEKSLTSKPIVTFLSVAILSILISKIGVQLSDRILVSGTLPKDGTKKA